MKIEDIELIKDELLNLKPSDFKYFLHSVSLIKLEDSGMYLFEYVTSTEDCYRLLYNSNSSIYDIVSRDNFKFKLLRNVVSNIDDRLIEYLDTPVLKYEQLYILLDNDLLEKIYGVRNKIIDDLLNKMNAEQKDNNVINLIPDLLYKPVKFKEYDYKLGDIISYGFQLPNGYLRYNGKSLSFTETGSKRLATQNELIKNLAKGKIKDYIKSAEAFGYGNKKKEMFESNGKFKITDIKFNYETKKHGLQNIIELNNGDISLKFLLDDIDIVWPNLKGYNFPSEKHKMEYIKPDNFIGKTARIVNNKKLPLKKNEKVIVQSLYNEHKPINKGKYVPYDRNSKVVVLKNDNTKIICKVKNIKII